MTVLRYPTAQASKLSMKYLIAFIKEVLPLFMISISLSQSIDIADNIYNDIKTKIEKSPRTGQRLFWDYFGGEACTFCPAVDMAFDQLLTDFPDDVVIITWADPYWSPFTDADLCINIDAIGECHDAREGYYNMTTSRPHYRLQGNQWQGTGGGITAADSANIYDNTIHPISVPSMGSSSPYELSMNGYRDSLTIYYDIKLTMNENASSEDMFVEIVFVEDRVPIFFTGDDLIHNVRNLARHWVGNELINIEDEGETQVFSGEMLMMDHILWQISDDDPWNPENMKLIAIVQNHNDGFIHQSMQKNVNEFDIDNDGIINRDDNCIFVSNPGQEDVDGDENGGDACDPCDSANIFTFGNVYGDYWEYDGQNLSYNVNIFDVMRLIEIVEASNLESCGYEAGDLTGEGEVNIFDIYALVGYLMDGLI